MFVLECWLYLQCFLIFGRVFFRRLPRNSLDINFNKKKTLINLYREYLTFSSKFYLTGFM